MSTDWYWDQDAQFRLATDGASFQALGLAKSLTLADLDWRFNPKLPRSACFELHAIKFIAEGAKFELLGQPGTRLPKQRRERPPRGDVGQTHQAQTLDSLPEASTVDRGDRSCVIEGHLLKHQAGEQAPNPLSLQMEAPVEAHARGHQGPRLLYVLGNPLADEPRHLV